MAPGQGAECHGQFFFDFVWSNVQNREMLSAVSPAGVSLYEKKKI